MRTNYDVAIAFLTGLALVLTVGVLIGCTTSKPPVALTVLTFNSATGAGWVAESDRDKQRAFLAAQGADVIGLQEVEVGCAHTGGVNTATEILPPGGTWVFGRATYHAGCETGVGLWLRPGFLLLDSWTVDLGYPGDVHPRVALYVRFRMNPQDPYDPVYVAAVTHLSTLPATRTWQIPEMVALPPDILLGDMNAQAEELAPTMAPIGLSLATAFGCIDQVWTRFPFESSVTRGMVPTMGASDHPYAARAVVWL